MTTKRKNPSKKDAGCVIRARAEKSLKSRLDAFCNRPDIRRSGAFIVRRALEEYMDKREGEAKN